MYFVTFSCLHFACNVSKLANQVLLMKWHLFFFSLSTTEHEPEKWDRVLTEKHIDKLAPLIGNNSLPFLIELDMAFQTWEQISHRQNKRDLVGLNTDILAEWRTKFCQTNGPKPTLRAIALAFHNIGKNRKFIEEVLFPQGSDIHNQ